MQHNAETAHRAITSANSIVPPSFIKLNEREMMFFEIVTKSKSPLFWDTVQLNHACNLAKLFVQIENIQEKLDTGEPEIIDNRINPLVLLLDAKINLSCKMSRFLAIHATATMDAHQMRKRNEVSRHAQMVSSLLDDDDLLAK